MASREARFNQSNLIDTTPLPDDIPAVKEIGSSSAPLMSAAYFIGARCRLFNDDFMKCKQDSAGRGELDCLKEGRKVTRCAASVLKDVNAHCADQFRKHWECLEMNNHQLYQCRGFEKKMNKCVYENLSLEKTIPGSPAGETPVHLRNKQIYANPLGATFLSRGS